MMVTDTPLSHVSVSRSLSMDATHRHEWLSISNLTGVHFPKAGNEKTCRLHSQEIPSSFPITEQ